MSKLSSRRKKQKTSLYWHQDFRIVETLPDPKKVRTAFILASFGIFLALASGIFWGIQRSEISLIQSELSEVHASIEAAKPLEKKNIGLSNEFKKQSRVASSFLSFYSNPFSASELLSILAQSDDDLTLLRSADLSMIEVRTRKDSDFFWMLTLRGSILTSDQTAGTQIKNYQDRLFELLNERKVLRNDKREDIRIDDWKLDEANQSFLFSLKIELKKR